MKYLLSVLFLFVTFGPVYAQEIEIPDTLSGWETDWDIRFSGSQASYTNWSQGGTNNIAAAARTRLTLMRKINRFSYAFRLDTRYGGARLSGDGIRKTEDRLFFQHRFLYDLEEENSVFKIFSNLTMRTQLDKGFDYGGGEDGADRLISRFMSPAVFNQNAGLAYILENLFTFEAGLGLQQKFVRDVNLGPVYGLDSGDRLRSEAGFTLGSTFETKIASNVEMKSSLNTFTNMKTSVRSTDVHFSKSIEGAINSNLNASFSFDLVYDDDFSNRVQVAQVISMGLTFAI